jgi:hypothetical protein
MAMTTNVANLKAFRGDSFRHEITVKNTDETVKDISATTAARYTLREWTFDGAQIFQKTLGSGIVLTDPTNGKLQVTLTTAEMATLNPQILYVYDCEITIGSEVQTVQKGTLTIEGDVSV